MIWKVVPEDTKTSSSFNSSTGNGVLKGPTIASNSGLVRSYPAAGRSGFLRGGMPLEIFVEFNPKQFGKVEERFRIQVQGGESVCLVCRGQGVLDENLLS